MTEEATEMPPKRVILIIDDAIDTLRLLCDALASEEYTVIIAKDALEALQRLEVAVPDGILLDAIMPGINGFELCRQIKRTPHWSHIPIIFMTGLSETEQIVEGFSSGGVDYVVKPLRIPEVLARLSTHVNNARVMRQAREAVDIGDRGIVVLDNKRRVAWRSPQAYKWLHAAFPDDLNQSQQLEWLVSAERFVHTQSLLPNNQHLVAQFLGESGLSEVTILLSVVSQSEQLEKKKLFDTESKFFLSSVNLTPRETEVLSWIAKGKTNRDIGDILGMSPRTVNKHLEHIFVKLGVETRTAAASVANTFIK